MTTQISPYSTFQEETTLKATLAYTDTDPKALFTIPEGAYVTDWILNVTTAFNDGTSNVIDIGIDGTAQKFAASVDVTNTGLKTSGVVAAQIGIVQSTAQEVLGQFTGVAEDASTGAMTILCIYSYF